MSLETKAKRSKTILNSRYAWDLNPDKTVETKPEPKKETNKTFTSKNKSEKGGRKAKTEKVETVEEITETTEDSE